MAQEDYRSETHGEGALEFERFVREALPLILPTTAVSLGETSEGLEVDFGLTLRDGRPALVEVKAVTPSTMPRLMGAAVPSARPRPA